MLTKFADFLKGLFWLPKPTKALLVDQEIDDLLGSTKLMAKLNDAESVEIKKT